MSASTSPVADRVLEWLYHEHERDVYRYTLSLLRSPEDAEDATQTTFLNAYRALRRGEQPDRPRSWLQTIALNVCRQRFRVAGRRPRTQPLDEHVRPSLRAERDGEEELLQMLRRLPERQRRALVMRELEGRSYREISAALGVSEKAVSTTIARARARLRNEATRDGLWSDGRRRGAWTALLVPFRLPAFGAGSATAPAAAVATGAKVAAAVVAAGALAAGGAVVVEHALPQPSPSVRVRHVRPASAPARVATSRARPPAPQRPRSASAAAPAPKPVSSGGSVAAAPVGPPVQAERGTGPAGGDDTSGKPSTVPAAAAAHAKDTESKHAAASTGRGSAKTHAAKTHAAKPSPASVRPHDPPPAPPAAQAAPAGPPAGGAAPPAAAPPAGARAAARGAQPETARTEPGRRAVASTLASGR